MERERIKITLREQISQKPKVTLKKKRDLTFEELRAIYKQVKEEIRLQNLGE